MYGSSSHDRAENPLMVPNGQETFHDDPMAFSFSNVPFYNSPQASAFYEHEHNGSAENSKTEDERFSGICDSVKGRFDRRERIGLKIRESQEREASGSVDLSEVVESNTIAHDRFTVVHDNTMMEQEDLSPGTQDEVKSLKTQPVNVSFVTQALSVKTRKKSWTSWLCCCISSDEDQK